MDKSPNSLSANPGSGNPSSKGSNSGAKTLEDPWGKSRGSLAESSNLTNLSFLSEEKDTSHGAAVDRPKPARMDTLSPRDYRNPSSRSRSPDLDQLEEWLNATESTDFGVGARPKKPVDVDAARSPVKEKDAKLSHHPSDSSLDDFIMESLEKVDEEPPDMYGIDRYEPSVVDAFGKISIHDLPQVKAMKNKASKVMLRRVTRGSSLDSPNIRQAKRSPDLDKEYSREDFTDEEEMPEDLEEAEEERQKEWDMLEDEKNTPPDSQQAIIEQTKAQLGLGTLLRVQNWVRQSRKVNVKSFAKDSQHLNLLVHMGNKFLIDTPVPVKILMYKELLPVLQATVSEYRHQLGRTHPMTIQAQDKVTQLQHWGTTLMDL